jgi:hypothetical protein
MVITKPLKVLVCLAVVSTFTAGPISWVHGADLIPGPGLQGDTLSADPRVKPKQHYRSPTKKSTYTTTLPARSFPSHTAKRSAIPVTTAPVFKVPVPAYCPAPACPPAVPAVYQPCPPVGRGFEGLFSSIDLGLPDLRWGVVLPRTGWKQVHVDAKLWYISLNSSTIVWGTNLIGGAASDFPGYALDLHRDLGLRKHIYVPEYEMRCQVRPNWGLRFSFMPLNFRDNFIPQGPFAFYFGNFPYAPGVPTLTVWDRYIYRWDIVYDWFQACHAMSSIFAGYSLYDDKLSVSNSVFSSHRSRSVTFGLGFAGMSIERVVRNIGSGTVSCNCKASVQFLEGYFGWDGYAAGRLAVPMACGRFGYLEAGWRWIVLDRGNPTFTDKTSLDGLTGTVGLVF